MTDKIAFDLVSPERLLLSTEAEMVTIPGSEGDMGVMAGHMPLISTLRPGVVALSGASAQRFYVSGGFAEVNPKKLTVLAEEAMPLAELDAQALDQRIKDAEEALALATSDAERAKAQDTLNYLKGLRAVV
jgi:F-type H+-transporting ATPase subunit epsilon